MSKEIAQQFTGLPMGELIAGPLVAACDGQRQLAGAMIGFIKTLAYENGKDGKPLTMPMSLQRPVQNADGSIGSNTVVVAPPLLGLVPIPALLIEEVNVDFSMEVKSASASKDTSSSSAAIDATAHYGFGFFSVSAHITGNVAASSENTRSTDNSAKYNVHVTARQQKPSEGMSKLMDLLASCVDPISSVPNKASK